MYKLIMSALIVLVAVLSTVSAKCDIMKEFKPEVEEMSKWGKEQCDTKGELTDDDLAKATKCYNDHVQPCMGGSDNGKAVDAFVSKKILGDPGTKKVCKDKGVQEGIKKNGMKDIGMKKGMELKKEVEADCPKFKKAMGDFGGCVKA